MNVIWLLSSGAHTALGHTSMSPLSTLWLSPPLVTQLSLIYITILFFLIKQERARLLRGQSVQQVGPQGLLYVQQRELAVTSPKDGRLGSSELGIIPKGYWMFYFISFLNRLHLHSGF